MRRTHSLHALSVLTLLVILNPAAVAAADQNPPPAPPAEAGSFADDLNLGFEASDHPEGWFAGGDGYSATIDKEHKHSGQRSLRLTFREAGGFGVATSRVPVDAVKGKRLRLIGFIKAEKITEGWAGLWMRVDGPDGVLAFDNMQQRGITGTTGWTRYEIELDVAEEAAEFFQLKHRMLEFLVEEMGFTVFAIEANWPECLAINEYVLEGKGDPKEALAGIYFWTWNTEEVLEQVEWMRRYNADPEREKKVKFYGFDMQTPTVAARDAIAYLERMDPELATNARELLAPLRNERAAQFVQTVSEEERHALADTVSELLRRFDERRAAWVESSGEREWIVARQKVVLLEQVLETSSGGTFNARDQAMAANLEWILETERPGTKVVAWAHNGHVSRNGSDAMQPMGSHLDRSLGDDYWVLGFVFNQGSFQAIDWTQGQGKGQGLIEHTVGPAPEGHLGAAFARAGMPIFVLDLRRVPAEGTVAGWFDVPHPMREIGAVFAGEEQMSHPVVLGDHYDGVIFVNETTRARPVQR